MGNLKHEDIKKGMKFRLGGIVEVYITDISNNGVYYSDSSVCGVKILCDTVVLLEDLNKGELI